MGIYTDDRLYGEDGDDILIGSEGNNIIDGGKGSDRMIGSEGNDFFIIEKNFYLMVMILIPIQLQVWFFQINTFNF